MLHMCHQIRASFSTNCLTKSLISRFGHHSSTHDRKSYKTSRKQGSFAHSQSLNENKDNLHDPNQQNASITFFFFTPSNNTFDRSSNDTFTPHKKGSLLQLGILFRTVSIVAVLRCMQKRASTLIL